MKLLQLPPELVEEILILCDPIDVAQVAQTCSTLRSLIYPSNNSKLWRELYLVQNLDDPRKCFGPDGSPCPHVDWKNDLQDIIRARTVTEDISVLRPEELEKVLHTLTMLVCYVRPWTHEDTWVDEELSKNLIWVAARLRNGFLDLIEDSLDTFHLQQLAARLHTYFGFTTSDANSRNINQSRAFVYLLRHYLPENDYGPYLSNGSVNWVHVRAIHHVVSTHLLTIDSDEEHNYRIYPLSLPFTQIYMPRNVDWDHEKDWVGVTGTWRVSFCFCDHRELLRFNDASRHEINTSLFEQANFQEAFRSLEVKLYVTKTEPDPEHPMCPMIYFYGEMNHPSTSTMTGRVKMSVDNQVQWRFISGEQGNAIWSSEGIQIGGLRSSFGILGSWTTVFHDTDDPVGPFWMHKHSGHAPTHDDVSMHELYTV